MAEEIRIMSANEAAAIFMEKMDEQLKKEQEERNKSFIEALNDAIHKAVENGIENQSLAEVKQYVPIPFEKIPPSVKAMFMKDGWSIAYASAEGVTIQLEHDHLVAYERRFCELKKEYEKE